MGLTKDQLPNGGDHIKLIRPVWFPANVHGVFTYRDLNEYISNGISIWLRSMLDAEHAYKDLLNTEWRPEQARSVLPNSLKTEIVVTANLREWRHVFKLRCSPAAHPQIRELMLSCLEGFKAEIPVLFEDLP